VKVLSNKAHVILSILLIISLCTATAVVLAASSAEHKGWEKDSTYNSLYNPRERDSMKGVVKKFYEVTPLPGMAEGTAFVLKDRYGEIVNVHLCPVSYASSKEVGFRKGDKVKVKGAWVEIDGEDVFIAAKVSKGDFFAFKVRLTSDGTPFWTMSAEQLAKERASQ